MSGNYTARSKFPLRQSANVIWSNLWDNAVTIGAPATAGEAYFFKSTVTGADSRGYAGSDLASLFGGTGVFEFQYIIDPSDTVLSSTFDTTVATSTAPGGKGKKITLLQKKRVAAINDGSRPQAQAITYLTATTRRSICIKQKFMLPSNLSNILDSYTAGTGVRWMEFFAIKNGNIGDPNDSTDSRFTIQAVRLNGETGMKYRFQFDSGAGGGTIYWGPFHSAEGSLVPGVWHEYTVYFEQPSSTSDTANGICKVVIQNLVSGEIVATLDQRGGQFYGSLGRKISRISPVLCYTGGWPATGTISIQFSDLEFSSNQRYPLNIL